MGNGSLFWGTKRVGRGADHFPPTIAERDYGYSYTSSLLSVPLWLVT